MVVPAGTVVVRVVGRNTVTALPSWLTAVTLRLSVPLKFAGGVIVSYFEWLQNKRSESWELQEVDCKLYRRIVDAYARVRETARQYSVDWRTAAYVVAINRVATVTRMRGMYA